LIGSLPIQFFLVIHNIKQISLGISARRWDFGPIGWTALPLSSLGTSPGYIEFKKKQATKNMKLDSLRIFSLSVLLISGPYIHAASRVGMRREPREVLPAMVFTGSEIHISME
jgi:hypothetical protein